MEPGRDGDIELHKGWHWDVDLCTSVDGGGGGGSDGGGSSVGVDGTDGVGSGGGVGAGCGDRDGAESTGRSCFWVE